MPIDPTDLANSIGALGSLDPERGLARTLQQVTDGAKRLFRADAAGLMLIDAEGQLRWASASDQTAQTLEDEQERLAQGPCAVAFSQRLSAAIRNIHTEPDWDKFAQVLLSEGICAALSVPVELDGGVIGTLDIYAGQPRDWDPSEVAALQAYAGLVASLLSAAVTAQVKGRLADQLQAALEHRWLIEQAKGVLMGREDLDAQAAFERLRGAARSSTRRLADVARDVTGGQPLPTNRRKLARDAPSRPRTGRPPPSGLHGLRTPPAGSLEDRAVRWQPCSLLRVRTACVGCSVALIFADRPVCGHVRGLPTHCQLTRNRAARFLARPPDPGPPSRSPNRGTRHRLSCRAASLSIRTVRNSLACAFRTAAPNPEAKQGVCSCRLPSTSREVSPAPGRT